MKTDKLESNARNARAAVTADQILDRFGSDVLVTTTDGLDLLLRDARTNESGRITARLSMLPSAASQRSDLTSIDGCAVDFAPSALLNRATALNCRVFGIEGSVGCLRIPGIEDVRPVPDHRAAQGAGRKTGDWD